MYNPLFITKPLCIYKNDKNIKDIFAPKGTKTHCLSTTKYWIEGYWL